ncbi:hypothetical protein V2J09_010037 [Rumex salicifolius]
MHSEFQSFLSSHWDNGASLSSALTKLAVHLPSWNSSRRIEGVQRSLCSSPNSGLLKLENKLRKQLDIVMDQIHLFWVQKARSDAMIDGDRNTHFFHTCTLIRHK